MNENVILIDREEKYIDAVLKESEWILDILVVDDYSKNLKIYKSNQRIRKVYTLSSLMNENRFLNYDFDRIDHFKYAFEICDYGSRRIKDDFQFSHFDFFHSVTFWDNYLTINRIDACIICNLFHGFQCDYILQEVALWHNIPCYHLFYQNAYRIALFDCNNKKFLNIREDCDILNARNDVIESAYYANNRNLDNENGELKKISKIVYKIGGAYLYRLLTLLLYGSYDIDHRNCSFWSYVYSCRQIYRTLKRNRKMYQAVNLSEKFVVYFIHFEPEAVITNYGRSVGSQLVSIQMIANELPDGWRLYVKEHPNMYNMNKWQMESYRHIASTYTTPYFYDTINSMENVCLIDYKYPASELINNAQVISTIAGTVATEAILKSKPLIVFNGNENILDSVGDCLCARSSHEICAYLEKVNSGFKPDYSDYYEIRRHVMMEDNIVNREKVIKYIVDKLV